MSHHCESDEAKTAVNWDWHVSFEGALRLASINLTIGVVLATFLLAIPSCYRAERVSPARLTDLHRVTKIIVISKDGRRHEFSSGRHEFTNVSPTDQNGRFVFERFIGERSSDDHEMAIPFAAIRQFELKRRTVWFETGVAISAVLGVVTAAVGLGVVISLMGAPAGT